MRKKLHVNGFCEVRTSLSLSMEIYEANSHIILFLAPSAHYIIELSIIELDIECSWDRLYLYDGSSFRDKLLGVYSGHLRPRPVYATSGAVS